jgi:hypothetical protein
VGHAVDYDLDMFLGVGEEGWEQLFSGFIGSLAAAIVAVVVLILTNKHQRALSTQQSTDQRELSNQQLAEQRAESSRVRRNEAIARIIFTATQFRQTVDDQARHALIADMESAVLLWEFEEPNETIFAELRLWPQLLFVESAKMFKPSGEGGVSYNQVLRMSEITFSITSNLKKWPGADADGRLEIVDNLAEARGDIPVMLVVQPVVAGSEGTGEA